MEAVAPRIFITFFFLQKLIYKNNLASTFTASDVFLSNNI